ncbi:MAG: Eco57I restriction-modification methylase domain-containing protein [Brasilonema angustatum HA4187-MV1]|jgi:superfamily II DNA/RNA helicase|nr:Eco57I restriction-modification methylase domain-containing protein [Brasilonema angustatum HA4187-MV1]
MIALEVQKLISNSLQNLKNIDGLKRLFWSQLNYDQVNKELSRRILTDAVKNELIDNPLLLASGGINNTFHVIYARLKSEDLSRQGERSVVNNLLKEHPYALFVFSNKSQSRWHFLNVKYDSSPQKRKLFRRITVGEGEQLRTATERISLLDLDSIKPDASPLDIQTRHDEAFDVEKVTDAFFKQYSQTFEKVKGLIQGIGGDERKRLFTQKLFNRLMFIGFIQKKGWLKFQGRIDYLSALWEAYQDEDGIASTKLSNRSNRNFYRDRLSHLFFSGLNNPQGYDIIGINNGGFLKDLIGAVPYLNGGLFEQDEDDKNFQIIIPDDCIKSILHDLFQRFAFTVTESTPLDVELAVDPEMLGKVFEELVTGRHESGSYYTPKPIVSFMCREALKGYLKTQVSGESSHAIAQFVDEHIPDNIKNSEAVLEALRQVRTCDLACGSGAYILGMLHELLDLRQCLSANTGLDSKNVYHRKLDIIENNLYGVDIDIFAVNIARLRLWLSLAVEYEGDNPPPLPNLKYKIEQGDSLIAPSPSTTGVIRHDFINQYRQKKAEYMRTHEGGKKRKLEEEINQLKTQIALVTHGSTKVNGFDWAVEFAEVFANGGFDIQVANPPYVRQELIKHLKPTLQKVYPAVYTGTSDLYCFFYARALQLLKPGGMLAFISSNKWFRAKYGEKLRKHIADACHVDSITDFGDLPVFKSATAYPMIFVAQSGKPASDSTIFTQVKSLETLYPDVLAIIREKGQSLPHNSLSGGNWMLTNRTSANRLEKMQAAGIPLSKYVNDKIYRGVVTGFNKAFVIDGVKRAELITKDPKNAEIIKPLAEGKNIDKWCIDNQEKWLIFTKRGINLNDYPAIKAYLNQWRTQLEPKPRDYSSDEKWLGRKSGSYKWYEIQDNVAYYSAFEQPKITWGNLSLEPAFTFVSNPVYLLAPANVIPIKDFYLLGILNSNASKQFFNDISIQRNGNYLEFKPIYVSQLPIPSASTTVRVLLFKRFESSVYAFQESIKKLLVVHERFLKALSQGFVAAGEEAQTLLSEDSNQAEEQDLMDGLQKVSDKYQIADFDAEKLQQHIEHDIKLLKNILALVEPITPDKDTKLQTLIKWLSKPTLTNKKRLIFTQYADTAKYLYDNLNPGGQRDDFDVIYSGSNKNKARLVGRFAPNANKEYKFKPGESELNTLIATDVLAEGLNLQDGDLIMNYDLHWNPVKLIQRFGRIDRIGSEKDVIYGYNFLPELGIERNLGLKQKLKNRIQEIHDTIGEDAAILDRTEQLNEEAMYAIYEQQGKQLSLFDFEAEEDFLDLNEAEEILRKLQKDNPEEYERIAYLPHGIRTAKFSMQQNGTYVFCEASDPNRPDIKGYQQLFLLDDKGEIISRDIPRILGAIKADSTTPTSTLPQEHNSTVMRLKCQFAEEVKHRQAEREFKGRLTQGQRYILRELRIFFKAIADEEVKSQVNILEKTFRACVNQAVNRELNKLRRDGFTGQELFTQLAQIYLQHNMHQWQDNSLPTFSQPIPIIICSEALV